MERDIVDRHKAINVHAERYPLSGASRFRGSGHDIDLYPFGRDAAPFVAEVKARGNGSGFTQLEKWLGDYQVLFLRRDRADPLVVLPWKHLGGFAGEGTPLAHAISPGWARVVGFHEAQGAAQQRAHPGRDRLQVRLVGAVRLRNPAVHG